MLHLPRLLRRVAAAAAAGLLLTACTADEVFDDQAAGDDDAAVGVELTPTGPECDALLDGRLLGSPGEDLETALAEHPQLTLVSELLEEVTLDPGPADFERPTFLAPVDTAVEAQLPVQQRADLIADEAALIDVLGLHLLPETWPVEDLLDEDLVGTVQGQDLPVQVDGDTVVFSSLGDATVLCGDIALADAVVHVIDRVLLPDTAAQTGGEDETG